MKHKTFTGISVILFIAITLTLIWPRFSFMLGGFFLHTGYVIQDWAESFHKDFTDQASAHPNEIYKTIIEQNTLMAKVWEVTPDLKDRKPKALLIFCIDPRLDDNRILGDSRGYYDIIRIPGSVITAEVAEAVELAVVKHGVSLVMVITHTDCAMERLATSREGRQHYPLLAEGINHHKHRLQSLSHRPAILKKLQKQEVWVIEKRIDTKTGKFI